MRTLVVYESLFGNTATAARAVAEGLEQAGHEVTVAEVGTVTPEMVAPVELLVVGAPTHAWSLPRPRTWVADPKARRAPPVDRRFVRDWLATLAPGDGRVAVAFATRAKGPRWLTGAATGAIRSGLRRRGWHPAAPPETFRVAGNAGPLLPGEVDRARAWGATLQPAARTG